MANEIPRLVQLDLYRNALSSIERLSRAYQEKKLHAWAVKAKKEYGERMVQLAKEEMDGSIEDEEEKQRRMDADFYGL